MTDPEFMDLAESLLRSVETVCDAINDEGTADIDNQRVGAMVTLVFANRSQIIINLQKPLHEVWMASRSGGYHFSWSEGCWQDTKGQGDFFTLLASDASAQAGVHLQFAP
jgi:CyaY protein